MTAMAGQTTKSNEGTSLLKEGLRLLEAGDADTAIANFSRVIEFEPGAVLMLNLWLLNIASILPWCFRLRQVDAIFAKLRWFLGEPTPALGLVLSVVR